MKIDIWIPAYNGQHSSSITSQLLRDVANLAANDIDFRFWSRHSCDLVWSRNNALHRAITDGYDWMWMQDADVFSDATYGPIIQLMQAARDHDATVAGAMVTMRTRPPKANVWPCQPGEVFEANKIGTGMVLIDLNKVREWYFDYDGPCFHRTYKTDKGIEQDIGLDIFFSYVVRQHGGTIVCDGRIPTAHVDGTHTHYYDGKQAPDAAVTAESTANEAA